jgi:inner membrane protease subunit 2
MQPTLNPDSNERKRDVLLVQKSGVFIDRGHVITFWSPRDANRLIAKRVVGLPGDLVKIDKTRYRLSDTKADFVLVPPGHVWVEGDAFHSHDSNAYGPIPFACVDGRAKWILWPWNRIQHVEQRDMMSRVVPSLDVQGDESIAKFDSFWWNWNR